MFSEEETNFCDLASRKISPKDCIGYGAGTKPAYLVLCILSMIVNVLFVIGFLTSVKHKKSGDIINLEKFLLTLSIIEITISFLWVMEVCLFFHTTDMEDNCKGTRIFASFMIFAYILDWLVVSQTIREMKVVMTNPILKIKSNKKFFLILGLCAALASLFAFIGYFENFAGISVKYKLFIFSL
ncbi:MAG: hypothetical protein MJ252_22170 [archaeon]|nr:hypothetical protein [archaeon]